MRILLGCLNVNGLGGSELYHYELAKELNHLGVDVTLFSLRSIDWNDQVRVKLKDLGVKQIDVNSTMNFDDYDLLVASQPQVNSYFISQNKATPIISIIHSEIRSEDPLFHTSIKHYIGIRQPIVDMLVNVYNTPKEMVSLIYNPIDQTRFNDSNASKSNKTTGIFVGEVLDPIRFHTVQHLVSQCIDNDWNLLLMSDSYYDFKHPNIQYVSRRWDTETLVKNADFTAGILLGRTTLEGWCCNVPGYIYNIDVNGSILGIDTDMPDNIVNLCNSTTVAKQHIELYNKIIKSR